MISVDGTVLKSSLTSKKLATLLKHALDTMVKNVPVMETFKYSEEQLQDLIFPVDFSKLSQKIKKQQYKTTAAYLSDVKWILHNLRILRGVSRPHLTSADKFVRACRSEMLDIEACPSCYEHIFSFEDNWFCKLCSVNHTLVWAKLTGHAFWPAKVLKVIDGSADIRFFGTYESAKIKVPMKYCLRLSKENPNRKMPQHERFPVALKELEIYVARVSKKFGMFSYHPHATIYNPGHENIRTKVYSRSALTVKSKQQNSLSKSSKNKDGTVLMETRNEVGDRIIPEDLSDSGAAVASASVRQNKVKRSAEQTLTSRPSKKARTKSNKTITGDANSMPATTAESSAIGSSPHQIAIRHSEANSVSSQCVLETPTGSSELSVPEVTSTDTSVRHTINSASSDVANSADGNDVTSRTELRIEETVNVQNSETFPAANPVSANNSTSSEFHSSTPIQNSSVETVPVTNESETHNVDVTTSEQTSASNDDAVMPEVPDIIHISSLSRNTGETSGLDSLVPDTEFGSLSSSVVGSNVILEFFEEEQENQNDLPFDQASASSIDILSSENVGPMQRRQPFSVEVPVHSSDNLEPVMYNHQPCPCCIEVPTQENSQDQFVCVHPLPEGLNMERYKEKVCALMRATVEEIWHDYVNIPNIQKVMQGYQKQIEELKIKHRKEIEELKRNFERDMSEISRNRALVFDSEKAELERKKNEAVESMKKKCEKEKEEAIKEVKRKQWCIHCGKEAMFYCCGKDSCCDHPCQRAHWVQTNIYNEQLSSVSADFGSQQNQEAGDINRMKNVYQTICHQQFPRGRQTGLMSNMGHMPPLYQVSPPFVSTPQPSSVVTSNCLPDASGSMPAMGSHSGVVMSNRSQMPPLHQVPSRPPSVCTSQQPCGIFQFCT